MYHMMRKSLTIYFLYDPFNLYSVERAVASSTRRKQDEKESSRTSLQLYGARHHRYVKVQKHTHVPLRKRSLKYTHASVHQYRRIDPDILTMRVPDLCNNPVFFLHTCSSTHSHIEDM